MATIVLGYDASPGAERALDTAVELASAFGDRLVIGFGVQPPGHGGGEGMEHRNALREQAAQLTAEALARATRRASRRRCRWSTSGRPSRSPDSARSTTPG